MAAMIVVRDDDSTTLLRYPRSRSASTRTKAGLRPARSIRPWIVPRPCTTKLHHLEENIGADDIVLTRDDLGGIAAVLATVTVQGDLYRRVCRQGSAVEG